jgi:hypothetical protein
MAHLEVDINCVFDGDNAVFGVFYVSETERNSAQLSAT